MTLSPRLMAAARYASGGKAVADVGTDHGYIPVWLAQNTGAERIIASDINSGPLERAKLSAYESGVEDRIEFHLTDGLVGIEGADTVIMAGMGGDTIRGIIEAAPWLRDGVNMVLQPQSKLYELVSWLFGEGFRIDDSCLARDAGRLYIIMSVRHTGDAVENCSMLDCFGAGPLVKNGDPLLDDWLQELEDKTERELRGLESGKDKDDPRIAFRRELLREIGER